MTDWLMGFGISPEMAKRIYGKKTNMAPNGTHDMNSGDWASIDVRDLKKKVDKLEEEIIYLKARVEVLENNLSMHMTNPTSHAI